MYNPTIGRDPEETSDPVVVARIKDLAKKYGLEIGVVSDVHDFRPPEQQWTDNMLVDNWLAVAGMVMLMASHRVVSVQMFLASPDRVDAWLTNLAAQEKPYQDGTVSAGPLWLGYGKDGNEFVGQTAPPAK